MPASPATSATRSGVRSRRTPRASSTSADPDIDDADRLPCLTPRAPAPAATIAAIVEMFTDIDRSPPVPTTSSSRPGTLIEWPAASIASASPETSSVVSPLTRRPTASPASWEGVASPANTSPSAHRACSTLRSCPATRVESTSGHVMVTGGLGGRRHARLQQRDHCLGELDRVDRVGYGGLGARPGGQPRVLRAADEHQDRRAPVDLVLELLGDAHASGRHRLAVEDGQVDVARV